MRSLVTWPLPGLAPVLIIAAGAVPDELNAARYIQTASPDSVQIWVAPNAGHVGGLGADPAEWQERVSTFLGAALGGGSAGQLSGELR